MTVDKTQRPSARYGPRIHDTLELKHRVWEDLTLYRSAWLLPCERVDESGEFVQSEESTVCVPRAGG